MKSLEGQKDLIEKSRSELIALGNMLDTDVKDAISIIKTVWNYVKDDATAILSYLQHGKELAAFPDYLSLQLGGADGACKHSFLDNLNHSSTCSSDC